MPRGTSAPFSMLFTCVLSTNWHLPPQFITPSLIKHAPIVFPHLLSRNPYILCVGTFEFSFTYYFYLDTRASKHINQHNPSPTPDTNQQPSSPPSPPPQNGISRGLDIHLASAVPSACGVKTSKLPSCWAGRGSGWAAAAAAASAV